MKKFSVQVLLLLTIIGITLFIYSSGSTIPNLPFIPFIPQPATLKQLQIGSAKLKVEIADTQEKRSKGLGGRENLATDAGMLFIFPVADKHPFWMKGLSFPLDFIWIKDDKVVDLLQNITPPALGQKDETLPIYQSRVDVDKVLEVNGGVIQRLNIKVGDTIKIK